MSPQAHEQRLETQARSQNGLGAHCRNLYVFATRGDAVSPFLHTELEVLE